MAQVQALYPRCAWLVDQAFGFMGEVLMSQHGLDETGSLVVVVLVLVAASFVPMMVFNYLVGMASLRSKRYWSDSSELQRFAFNEAGDSNLAAKLEVILTQLVKDVAAIEKRDGGTNLNDNSSQYVAQIASIEQ